MAIGEMTLVMSRTSHTRPVQHRYRVPFTGGMGVLWTIYLSLLNVSKGGASQKAAESVEA